MEYIKTLVAFFRFIKEVILGKATLAQAYQYDRRRVWVLIAIFISLGLNIITLPALYRATEEVIELRREVTSLQQTLRSQPVRSLGLTLK